MTAGFPTKTDYVDGEVFSADDINSTNGTINYIDPTSATDGQVLTRDAASPGQVKWDTVTVAESLGFTAGKNKIINGDFRVNQRAFTSITTSGIYGFDRWVMGLGDGTVTYSAETFTPGAAPVAGYEAINFARVVTTGQTATSAQARLRQHIEDVRTFADQTVTLSFWAKASSGTPNVAVSFNQRFGSGGSSAVDGTGQKFAITTSWVRYSKTFTIPSVSGKTIGTGSNLSLNLWTSAGSNWNALTDSLGIQSVTVDIWGVQLEAGSTATAFQTATGTIQGELAACQRYYYRHTTSIVTGSNNFGVGLVDSSTNTFIKTTFPVTMRISPTALEQTGTAANYAVRTSGVTITTCSVVPAFSNATTNESISTFVVSSGLTAGQAALGRGSTDTVYLAWSAEL
jgi:hypothetical protein